MKIIVVGGGNVGKNLSFVLSEEKNKVVLVEKDEDLAKALALNTDALVIRGDATDITILEDADIGKTEAIVAATQDDTTNLMICEIAKSRNVKKIVARVNTPGNEELFVKLGISLIVPVTELAVTSIKNALVSTGERVLAEIADGKAQAIEVVVTEKSTLVGAYARKVKGGVIGAVYRNGAVIVCDINTKIEAGDVLTIIAKTEDIPRIIKAAKGENS